MPIPSPTEISIAAAGNFPLMIFPKKSAEKIIPIKSETAQTKKKVLKNTVR